jgi:hypothetical protein
MASHVRNRRIVAQPDQNGSEQTARANVRTALPLHARARMAARAALAVSLVMLALWTAADFLPALIRAAILAITMWPLYVRFASLLGSPSLKPRDGRL